jgi:hypothetical protein
MFKYLFSVRPCFHLTPMNETNDAYISNTNMSCIDPNYYYHWVDTTAGELFVSEGSIRPVVSVQH